MSSKFSKPTLIGLSLSYCVCDLVWRRVPYYRVLKLITGTAVPEDGWKEFLKWYSDVYWSHWPERVKNREGKTDEELKLRAISLVNRLRAEGKIEQPRLTTGLAPRWGHRKERWVQDESEIKYWKPGENDSL